MSNEIALTLEQLRQTSGWAWVATVFGVAEVLLLGPGPTCGSRKALNMFPDWLHSLSIAALALGGLCLLVIAFDVARHPQKMAVMNIVWPVTALFGTVLTLWGFFHYGRDSIRRPCRGLRTRSARCRQRPNRSLRSWAKVRFTVARAA